MTGAISGISGEFDLGTWVLVLVSNPIKSARMPDGHTFLSSFSFDFRHFTAASPDPQPDLECQVETINHLKYAGLDNITWPHYHMIL